MTTDLLSVWTDSETAMHAVDASVGILGEQVADAGIVRSAAHPLPNELYDVLLGLVERGELEQRACSDGRYAFRWRGDAASTASQTAAESARLVTCLEDMCRDAAFDRVAPDQAPFRRPPVERAPAELRHWPSVLTIAAPLALPASSCLLALLAFVWFGRSVALVIAVALTVIGVVGLIRRVPLAGFWTVGVIVAGLLLRFS